MTLEGGTYTAAWTIGDSAVRGVVDTGSPFLTTMRASCDDSWGCARAGDVSLEASIDRRDARVANRRADAMVFWTTSDDWDV